MGQYDEKQANESDIQGVLSAKGMHTAGLDEEEREIIAREHANYINAYADTRFHAALDSLQPTLNLLRDSEQGDAIRRALAAARPRPTLSQSGAAEAHIALDDHIRDLIAGCDGRISTPPFTSGEPLQEEFDTNAVDKTGTFDLATYTALAVPEEGVLSLGVGIGQIEKLSSHPPSFTENFDLEWTGTSAMLTEYIPAPAAQGGTLTALTVAVDAVLGDGSRPFFYVNATGPKTAGVFGILFLTLYESSSKVPRTVETRFLFYAEDMDGPVPSLKPVNRFFSLSNSFNLNPNTVSVLAIVDVVLRAYRHRDTPDYDSFAMIDLRSPDHITHRIHFAANNGGPILIPRISATFCRRPEALLGDR